MKIKNSHLKNRKIHGLKPWIHFFLLLPICFLMAGCFPYHYTTSPGLSGTVVNAETRKPLAGAAISYSGRTNNTVVTFSADDGSFSVAPERKWGIWIIPQDVFMMPCTISFSHAGCETNYVKFSFSFAMTGKDATKQFGIVALKPLSQ